MIAKMLLLLSVLTALLLAGCNARTEEKPAPMLPENFGDYWYQGKAELTRYSLEQARYGEIHTGEAVLIFVTEDFLSDQQIKYEFGPGDNKETVLKLNAARHFYTGIYPYSLLTSTFTPLGSAHHKSLKVSASTQEWCGHAYTQLNLRERQYRVRSHSYFQKEGDRDFEVPAALLEDEIWTLIRLSPENLPTGEISLIPGLQHTRLRHLDLRPYAARATRTTTTDPDLPDQPLQTYTVTYSEISRTLTITYEEAFPHRILKWEETVQSGFGDPKILTTKAVRTNSMMAPYWQMHSVADSTARRELGLE